MLVMKFGGTSVSAIAGVLAIKTLVEKERARRPVLVISALSGVTDLLVKLSHTILSAEQEFIFQQIRETHHVWINNIWAKHKKTKQEAVNRIEEYLDELKQALCSHNFSNQLQLHDSLVAFGECMSTFLISLFLNYEQIPATQVLATQCIVTARQFGGTDFLEQATKRNCQKVLLPLINSNIVPVVTGFIASTVDGEITILGRGGSDYSAAIIGYALNSEEIQIWTDVDGVYSADPRVIKDACLLSQLSYQEASELAMFGAKILHPRTIKPAIKANIPVRVLNTFNLVNNGTLIVAHAENSLGLVKAVTWRKEVPLINLYTTDMILSKSFLPKAFNILTKHNLAVNMISAAEASVSITLDKISNLDKALVELNKFAKAEYIEGFGTISLVGEQIMDTPSLMQDIFDLFVETNTHVQMISYSASNINISVIVPSDKIEQVVALLHRKFINNLV